MHWSHSHFLTSPPNETDIFVEYCKERFFCIYFVIVSRPGIGPHGCIEPAGFGHEGACPGCPPVPSSSSASTERSQGLTEYTLAGRHRTKSVRKADWKHERWADVAGDGWCEAFSIVVILYLIIVSVLLIGKSISCWWLEVFSNVVHIAHTSDISSLELCIQKIQTYRAKLYWQQTLRCLFWIRLGRRLLRLLSNILCKRGCVGRLSSCHSSLKLGTSPLAKNLLLSPSFLIFVKQIKNCSIYQSILTFPRYKLINY